MDQLCSNLETTCVLCKPKSVFQFCLRYINDEKLSLPSSVIQSFQNSSQQTNIQNQIIEEYHSIHFLPFLLFQVDEFRNYACIVFCAEQMYGYFSRDLHQTVGNASEPSSSSGFGGTSNAKIGGDPVLLALKEPGIPSSSSMDSYAPSNRNSNPSTQAAYREYLDGNTVLDIVSAMDLQSHLGFSCPFLDDLIVEKYEILKKIDFNLFITLLRFPLTCYQAIAWCKDELFDFFKNSEIISSSSSSSSSLSTVPSILSFFPLKDDISVDISKLKSFLSK
jgi:hypothetical protein